MSLHLFCQHNTAKPLVFVRNTRGFLLFYLVLLYTVLVAGQEKILDPSNYPLQVRNTFYEVLHSGGAGLSHFLCDVPINVQRKGSGVVSEIALHRLNIVPGPEGTEVVLTEVAPEELVRFNEAHDAFMEAEQAMGPTMGGRYGPI